MKKIDWIGIALAALVGFLIVGGICTAEQRPQPSIYIGGDESQEISPETYDGSCSQDQVRVDVDEKTSIIFGHSAEMCRLRIFQTPDRVYRYSTDHVVPCTELGIDTNSFECPGIGKKPMPVKEGLVCNPDRCIAGTEKDTGEIVFHEPLWGVPGSACTYKQERPALGKRWCPCEEVDPNLIDVCSFYDLE